ncbi:hypothetical protein JKL50_09795 [Bacillus altitudinis]|uniref:hypothetical protein n=1 Tax=Bacillus TaxID=1386 RepID=UPI00192AA42A|nr:hypothetical protein [Bacillus altitudinis]QQX16371.1 hypothetical protein JKL50_09795 [Bacillus altitudinis]
MNKLNKGLIVSVLSISSLAFPTLTNQASAQEPTNVQYNVQPANKLAMDYHMRTNRNITLLNGFSRWEIIHGNDIISINSSGVVSSHSKTGVALVYAYDKNDKRLIYKITVHSS